MPKKYYVDSSIWRDYFENRVDRFRPLGEWAFEFLRKAAAENDIIIISDVLIDELGSFSSKLNEVVKDFEINVKYVNVDEKQILRARKLSRVHYSDAVHLIVATDNRCVLITRDHDFDECASYLEIHKPEDLL
ncbi:MAG: PIN domain-containing protein [Candidatus Woesearchaeota archaeon]